MAFSPEGKNSKDMAWYSKMSAAVRERVQGTSKDQSWDQGCVHPEFVGNVPDEPRQWRGFEFAEDMEQGVAPGITTTYVEPPAHSEDAKEQRLVVHRTQNRMSYSLQTEAGETKLVAKASSDGCRFDMYVARDGEPPMAFGPAFTLVASNTNRDYWVLCTDRCDRCESKGKRKCGRRELMRLSHYVETVGEGQAFCMDVEQPHSISDGSAAVVCEKCGDASTQWGLDLSARRPKWNPKHKSLTLDFHGRCSVASAKNFQLEDPSNPGKVKLLFGKVAEHRFTLDYRFPLGMVQAFACALSASHWK